MTDQETLLFIKLQADKLAKAISAINFPEEVSVGNFDEVKAHLRNELTPALKRIEQAIRGIQTPKDVQIPSGINVNNLPDLQGMFERLTSAVDAGKKATEALEAQIKAIELSPTINVASPVIPEIRLPEINVPKTETTVEIDISAVTNALKPLELLSNKASKPISVRMSDGKKFVEALKQASQGMTAFSTSVGMTIDELKAFLNTKKSKPNYDQRAIDETDPASVTVTYKKDGATVLTETISVSGAVTTITES